MHNQVLGKGFQLLGYELQFIYFQVSNPLLWALQLTRWASNWTTWPDHILPFKLVYAYPFWSTGLCAPSHLLMQIFLYWWGKEISLFELVHVYPFGELWSLCCIPHFDADLSIHGWWWKEAIAKGFQISQSAFCLADSVHPHKAMKGFRHPHVAIKRLQHPHVAVKGLQHPHVAVKGLQHQHMAVKGPCAETKNLYCHWMLVSRVPE